MLTLLFMSTFMLMLRLVRDLLLIPLHIYWFLSITAYDICVLSLTYCTHIFNVNINRASLGNVWKRIHSESQLFKSIEPMPRQASRCVSLEADKRQTSAKHRPGHAVNARGESWSAPAFHVWHLSARLVDSKCCLSATALHVARSTAASTRGAAHDVPLNPEP